MADYKVEVDLSDLFDDMTISEQKNFLVDKFSSLPIDKMMDSMFRKATFLLKNRNVSQRYSMSSLSRELRLWQHLRRTLSRSLIIVKSKAYGTEIYSW